MTCYYYWIEGIFLKIDINFIVSRIAASWSSTLVCKRIFKRNDVYWGHFCMLRFFMKGRTKNMGAEYGKIVVFILDLSVLILYLQTFPFFHFGRSEGHYSLLKHPQKIHQSFSSMARYSVWVKLPIKIDITKTKHPRKINTSFYI